MRQNFEDGTGKCTYITATNKKIPSITSLVTSILLNTKVIEIEKKASDIFNLATKALNAKTAEIRNKIPDTSHFINTRKFNWLTKTSFETRMKEAEKSLVSKTEVNNAVNLGEKNWKKTHEKRQTFSLGYFLIISNVMKHII